MSACLGFVRVLLVASLALAVVAATVASPPVVQRRLRNHRLGTSFKQVWSSTVPGAALSYEVMNGDPLVMCTDTTLSGLNVSTGQMLYSTVPVQGTLISTDENKVVVSGGNPTLQVFNRNTGAPLWSSSACSVITGDDFAATTRVMYCMYYGPGMNQSAGLNMTTGATVWAGNWISFFYEPCGPKGEGQRHTLACVLVRSTSTPAGVYSYNVTVVEISTGKVRWVYPNVVGTQFPTSMATETTFVAFFQHAWMVFDVMTGKMKAQITIGGNQTTFTPITHGFGIFCGRVTAYNDIDVDAVCVSEQGKIVVNKTYPLTQVSSMMPESMFVFSKTLMLVASTNASSTGVDAIEVGTSRVVWFNAFLSAELGNTITFFPPALASFFAVMEINGLSLWHARTGAFIARLENEPFIINVFVNEKAPGRIFTVGNTTVASYRLQ